MKCLVLTLALGALGLTPPVAASPVRVLTLKLSISNVHVLQEQGHRPLLIDAGGRGDLPLLEKKLAAHGLKIEDLAAVILTHGHSDHAGLAAEIRRRSGARILLGAGDVELAKAGRNDELKPTNLTAVILKRFFIDPVYEPFQADQVISRPFDLAEFGYPGQVLPMPGHTAGSQVILLEDGRAFVGDMMAGGWFGGGVFAHRAGEHYFQADCRRNRANIETLLQLPITTCYLGHGGPVSRAAVLKGFGLADPRR